MTYQILKAIGITTDYTPILRTEKLLNPKQYIYGYGCPIEEYIKRTD